VVAGAGEPSSLFEFHPEPMDKTEPMDKIKNYLDLVSEQWDQALSRLKWLVEG
jgi:hypothetical protein